MRRHRDELRPDPGKPAGRDRRPNHEPREPSPARDVPKLERTEDVVRLSSSAGNRAVQSLLASPRAAVQRVVAAGPGGVVVQRSIWKRLLGFLGMGAPGRVIHYMDLQEERIALKRKLVAESNVGRQHMLRMKLDALEAKIGPLEQRVMSEANSGARQSDTEAERPDSAYVAKQKARWNRINAERDLLGLR